MHRAVTTTAIALVASIGALSSAPAQGGTPPSTGARQVAARDPMQEGLPLRPGRTLTFTTNVGQWMSVDVSPDGRRFLMIKASEADQTTVSARIIVVPRWIEELKRLVPVN